MGMVTASTDYVYEFEERSIRIKIGAQSGTAMVQFFVDNRLVYYKPMSDVECEITMDYELIKEVLSTMEDDKDRWMPGYEIHCEWLTCYFNDFVSTHRIGKYKFRFDDLGKEFYFDVEEHWDDKIKMRLTCDGIADKVMCEFDISQGTHLLKRSEDYLRMLERLLQIFAANASEINKSTFNKHIKF